MQDLRVCDANVDYISPLPDSTYSEYCEIHEVTEYILPTIREYEQLQTIDGWNGTHYEVEMGNEIEVEEISEPGCNNGDYLHPTYSQE